MGQRYRLWVEHLEGAIKGGVGKAKANCGAMVMLVDGGFHDLEDELKRDGEDAWFGFECIW